MPNTISRDVPSGTPLLPKMYENFLNKIKQQVSLVSESYDTIGGWRSIPSVAGLVGLVVGIPVAFAISAGIGSIIIASVIPVALTCTLTNCLISLVDHQSKKRTQNIVRNQLWNNLSDNSSERANFATLRSKVSNRIRQGVDLVTEGYKKCSGWRSAPLLAGLAALICVPVSIAIGAEAGVIIFISAISVALASTLANRLISLANNQRKKRYADVLNNQPLGNLTCGTNSDTLSASMSAHSSSSGKFIHSHEEHLERNMFRTILNCLKPN